VGNLPGEFGGEPAADFATFLKEVQHWFIGRFQSAEHAPEAEKWYPGSTERRVQV
jgi:hypothetical protein